MSKHTRHSPEKAKKSTAAKAKKALKVVVQDLRGLSDVCQFQLICSGTNDRQNIAISQSIEDHLRMQFNVRPMAVEGKKSGSWIVLDYGPTLVHIFDEEIRDYYAIETLWPAAKEVALTGIST